jgi:hypothetical protein
LDPIAVIRKKSIQRHPGEGRDPEAFETLAIAKAQ